MEGAGTERWRNAWRARAACRSICSSVSKRFSESVGRAEVPSGLAVFLRRISNARAGEGNYNEIMPVFSAKRRLKTSTFKVEMNVGTNSASSSSRSSSIGAFGQFWVMRDGNHGKYGGCSNEIL